VKLQTLRRYALSLEGATEAPHHSYASFRVAGRIFLTVPPEGDVAHIFVGEDDRERALALHPEWADKLLWGGKVRGLRITLSLAAAAPVKALARRAYACCAAPRPKRATPRSGA
jgi:hypothetical protein